eukprot:scaffold3051_cov175-Amphora_coffeaeformis.AAC.5
MEKSRRVPLVRLLPVAVAVAVAVVLLLLDLELPQCQGFSLGSTTTSRAWTRRSHLVGSCTMSTVRSDDTTTTHAAAELVSSTPSSLKKKNKTKPRRHAHHHPRRSSSSSSSSSSQSATMEDSSSTTSTTTTMPPMPQILSKVQPDARIKRWNPPMPPSYMPASTAITSSFSSSSTSQSSSSSSSSTQQPKQRQEEEDEDDVWGAYMTVSEDRADPGEMTAALGVAPAQPNTSPSLEEYFWAELKDLVTTAQRGEPYRKRDMATPERFEAYMHMHDENHHHHHDDEDDSDGDEHENDDTNNHNVKQPAMFRDEFVKTPAEAVIWDAQAVVDDEQQDTDDHKKSTFSPVTPSDEDDDYMTTRTRRQPRRPPVTMKDLADVYHAAEAATTRARPVGSTTTTSSSSSQGRNHWYRQSPPPQQQQHQTPFVKRTRLQAPDDYHASMADSLYAEVMPTTIPTATTTITQRPGPVFASRQPKQTPPSRPQQQLRRKPRQPVSGTITMKDLADQYNGVSTSISQPNDSLYAEVMPTTILTTTATFAVTHDPPSPPISPPAQSIRPNVPKRRPKQPPTQARQQQQQQKPKAKVSSPPPPPVQSQQQWQPLQPNPPLTMKELAEVYKQREQAKEQQQQQQRQGQTKQRTNTKHTTPTSPTTTSFSPSRTHWSPNVNNLANQWKLKMTKPIHNNGNNKHSRPKVEPTMKDLAEAYRQNTNDRTASFADSEPMTISSSPHDLTAAYTVYEQSTKATSSLQDDSSLEAPSIEELAETWVRMTYQRKKGERLDDDIILAAAPSMEELAESWVRMKYQQEQQQQLQGDSGE